MLHTEVLIVGGGPAGSTCARVLRAAGLDVTVCDKAVFPRDKVCAGWITPHVVNDLQLNLAEYARGRTLQPITGFRVGLIGESRATDITYDRSVSYGVRRSEFDHYLLERAGARLRLGRPVSSVERAGTKWVVNGDVSAPMLVGAGGHFCPIAKRLNPSPHSGAQRLVAARESETLIAPGDEAAFRALPERPELYFCRDLEGYGWCFRKGRYVNVGLGRTDTHALPQAVDEFVSFLESRGTVPRGWRGQWRGHAYLLAGAASRRVHDDGVLLLGDAAGLAAPHSGEGIRPAVASGLLAAEAILGAHGRYAADRLAPYEARLRARFSHDRAGRALSRMLPAALATAWFARLLDWPWLLRRLVLERAFLQPADLGASPPLHAVRCA